MRKLFLLFVAGMFLCRCSGPEDKSMITFSRDDFPQTIVLKDPLVYDLDEQLLYPASFYVVQDTVLVVQNQPGCEYLLELYSLNTLQPLLQTVRMGNGPEELSSCICYIYSGMDPVFYLDDYNTGTWHTVNMDSMLTNKRVQFLDKFQYTSNRHIYSQLAVLNKEKYITYNLWYLDDAEYTNGVSDPLAVYSTRGEEEESPEDIRYLVAPVNGAQLFWEPVNRQVFTADIHKDVIRIYDESLNPVKSLIGPDAFNPVYSVKDSNTPIPYVGFAGDKEYKAYSAFTLTDKHIYIIYEGNRRFDPANLSPVEVFKLDLNGNLLCNYQLDRYIFTVSVDSNEEYLYGTSRESLAGESTLVRYKL